MKVLVISFFVLSVAFALKDLPPYFPRCHRSDLNISACLLKATEQVRPFLTKGVPELGIQALRQFIIPEISLKQGTDSLNINALLKNVSIFGLDQYQFKTFNFDVKTLQSSCDVVMPHLYMEGTYSVRGKILVAPIEGNGLFHGNFSNSFGTLNVHAKLEEKNGVNYLIYTKIETKITADNITDYGLTGLFDDNPALVKATREVFQENAAEIIKEITPVIEHVMDKLFGDIVFKTLEKIPFEKLYPE